MVECHQLWLSSSQTAELFDHQYLWKELITLLDFLHADNHQEKVAPETITFGRVWPVVHLSQSFNGQYFWKESTDILDFLHGDNH